jgi:hypothetical protein
VSNNLSVYADIASVVIAFLAFIVACVSIWMSKNALHQQERHNVLSVKPIPFISFANYENLIRAKLINQGLGPLIVKRIEVTDGEKKENDVIKFMPLLPEGLFWSTYTSAFENRAMLPGGEIIFLEFKCSDHESEIQFRDECRAILSKLTITCFYEDIYGHKGKPCSRSGEWFSGIVSTQPEKAG